MEERVERLRKIGSLHKEKARKLLLKSFAEREGAYKARHLQDTRYIIRVFRLLLEQHWPELRAPRAGEAQRIYTRPGALTALVRRGLGVDDAKRGGRLGDRDHALDAIVVAWTNNAVVDRLTDGAKQLELQARAKLVPQLVADPQQKERLRQAILTATEAVFVSRPENRRGRGPVHQDTLFGFQQSNNGSEIQYKRVAVTALKPDDLARLKGNATEPGESDRNHRLREVLSEWLARAGGRPQKLWDAGERPRMPAGEGRAGPVIAHVHVRRERTRVGLKLQRGRAISHADTAGLVRIDVFRASGKFVCLPIYVWQVADRHRFPTPPSPSPKVAGRRGKESVSDDLEFLFSLYPGAFVAAITASGECHEGYYRTFDGQSGELKYQPPYMSDSKHKRRFKTMTLSSFRKFHVDRLGNRFEIVREPRLWHGEVCS